ncbi:hypothetical protein CPB85DRAFT_54328 [Mucidula mucida]|nr:hypothetical protein CPB85DRAFT_54328 [Mucidula mucida]
MESTWVNGNAYAEEYYPSQHGYVYGADSYVQERPDDYAWPTTYASPDTSSETQSSYSAASDMPLHAPVPQAAMMPLYYSYEEPASFATKPLMTFPTPSEMLSDFSMAPSPSSSSRSFPPPPEKTESARKARRRAMANNLGFLPTDPDTISSHEKKRHYLECLEHYVVYLHEQLKLVGAQPVALERVSNYRGLSSRSIRTLLVHMEHTTRKLNLQRISEEQRFLTLRDTALKQQATAEALRQYQSNV